MKFKTNIKNLNPKSIKILAVDMGFSKKLRSVGLSWSGCTNGKCFKFGDSITKTVNLLNTDGPWMLVIEAPLSQYYTGGNPILRNFENTNHAWYYNSGSSMQVSAMRFLEQISKRLVKIKHSIYLTEAYYPVSLGHANVAAGIYRKVPQIKPYIISGGVRILPQIIPGVPAVYII